MPGHRAGRNIDDGDAVRGGQRHIGLAVVGEGDAHRFVEPCGEGCRVDVLNGGDHLVECGARRVRIDDADRVGDMVGHPDFAAVRPHRDADRIDAHVNPANEGARRHVENVHRVGGRVRDVDE